MTAPPQDAGAAARPEGTQRLRDPVTSRRVPFDPLGAHGSPTGAAPCPRGSRRSAGRARPRWMRVTRPSRACRGWPTRQPLVTDPPSRAVSTASTYWPVRSDVRATGRVDQPPATSSHEVW